MKGHCRLYDREEELMKSHIIPKFAFDYMKKTGGYFRAFSNPNVRVQDGPKKYLLSADAEQEFSKRERWFANNIFFPYQKGEKNKFEYDENLGYFVVSVLWRVLLGQMDHDSVSKESKLDFLSEVAEEWKDFLANGKKPVKFTDLNIFLTDRLASTPSTNNRIADVYFSRAIDATVIANKNCTTVGIYVKFLRFVVWSIVKGEPTKGKGIKINLSKGSLSTPQIINDDYFGNFLFHRVQELESLPSMSKQQEQKTIDEIIKNEDKFWNSDAAHALMNDYRLSLVKPTPIRKGVWERMKLLRPFRKN